MSAGVVALNVTFVGWAKLPARRRPKMVAARRRVAENSDLERAHNRDLTPAKPWSQPRPGFSGGVVHGAGMI